MSDILNEILQKDMNTIRDGFIMYCRLLGLSKDTCLALILMLPSKKQLVLLMAYMAQIDGGKIKIPEEQDNTTAVVLKAEEIKDKIKD